MAAHLYMMQQPLGPWVPCARPIVTEASSISHQRPPPAHSASRQVQVAPYMPEQLREGVNGPLRPMPRRSAHPPPLAHQQLLQLPQVSSSNLPYSAPSPPLPDEYTRQGSTKEKCCIFLANLLELSSQEPGDVERSVQTLVQELVDARVQPWVFCERLERLFKNSPQPYLTGFLMSSLPRLRKAMVLRELSIEGINPPPHSVAFPNEAHQSEASGSQRASRSSQVSDGGDPPRANNNNETDDGGTRRTDRSEVAAHDDTAQSNDAQLNAHAISYSGAAQAVFGHALIATPAQPLTNDRHPITRELSNAGARATGTHTDAAHTDAAHSGASASTQSNASHSSE